MESLSINRLNKEGDSESYSLSTRLIPPTACKTHSPFLDS